MQSSKLHFFIKHLLTSQIVIVGNSVESETENIKYKLNNKRANIIQVITFNMYEFKEF